MKDLSRRATLLVSFGYDGAPFFGLQPQPGLPTAGGALEARLLTAAGQRARGMAFAARTDRGVHALRNAATCWFPAAEIDPAAVARALVAAPADGLVVAGVWRVPASVHARNVGVGKHYRYVIIDAASDADANGEHPRAWSVVPALDVDAMKDAAGRLLGTWDFSSVRGGGCSAATPVKTITRFDITRADDGSVVFDIEGDAFLRHMVRNLAGLLVEIGAGWRRADEVPAIIAARHRQAAGLMAPPGGLSLIDVLWRTPDVGERLA